MGGPTARGTPRSEAARLRGKGYGPRLQRRNGDSSNLKEEAAERMGELSIKCDCGAEIPLSEAHELHMVDTGGDTEEIFLVCYACALKASEGREGEE